MMARRDMKQNWGRDLKNFWIAGVCGAAVLFAGIMPLQAEPSSGELRALYNRLEKMERDLIDVQRQTYQAGSAAGQSSGPAYGPDPSSAADLSLRLQSVEDQLRTLTGQIEKLSFDLSQTRNQFNQFAEDTEFRFQELGAGGSGAAPGSSLGEVGAATNLGAGGAGATSTAADTFASSSGTLGTIPLSPQRNERESVTLYPPNGGGQGSELAPEDAYDGAINQLKRGQFDAAEADLANFLQRYPTHSLAGNAQYWLGETYYVRGAYRQAAEAFLTGYTTYSSSSKAPDSLLKLGMTLAALGQKDQACATLGQLRSQFPSASQAVTQRAELERGRAGC